MSICKTRSERAGSQANSFSSLAETLQQDRDAESTVENLEGTRTDSPGPLVRLTRRSR